MKKLLAAAVIYGTGCWRTNKLSQAFRVFFKNPEHFSCPRFKKEKTDQNSFTTCNHKFESGSTIYITRDGIRVTKAGIVKAVFPRCLRSGWKLKRVTVEKTSSEKIKVTVQGLRELPILWGEVLERGGEERPDCVSDK